MKNISKYLLLQLVILIYAVEAIPSKLASNESFLSTKFCIFYCLALFLLVIYALLWQQILKKFPLTIAYACKATTIIWSILIGYFIFNEKVSFTNILGALIVIVGIIIMVKGEHAND